MSTFTNGSGGIPKPPPPPPPSQIGQSSGRLIDTQRQVDEITDIMRQNMEKLVERDIKLSELEGRADNMNEQSKIFKTTTTKIHKKYWWKNTKWMIIIGISGVILLIILAISIFTAFL